MMLSHGQPRTRVTCCMGMSDRVRMACDNARSHSCLVGRVRQGVRINQRFALQSFATSFLSRRTSRGSALSSLRSASCGSTRFHLARVLLRGSASLPFSLRRASTSLCQCRATLLASCTPQISQLFSANLTMREIAAGSFRR